MEKDNTLLMRCATAAQKAADFLLQVNDKKEPKFYKDWAVLERSDQVYLLIDLYGLHDPGDQGREVGRRIGFSAAPSIKFLIIFDQ